MIHKAYTIKWIVLVVGIIFLLLSVYSILNGTKRDKIFSIGVFLVCLLCFITVGLKINSHGKKAKKYLGIYTLKNYRDNSNYKLEILPDYKYQIFDEKDTIVHGVWELTVSEDRSTMLLLDGRIFGTGEFEIK